MNTSLPGEQLEDSLWMMGPIACRLDFPRKEMRWAVGSSTSEHCQHFQEPAMLTRYARPPSVNIYTQSTSLSRCTSVDNSVLEACRAGAALTLPQVYIKASQAMGDIMNLRDKQAGGNSITAQVDIQDLAPSGCTDLRSQPMHTSNTQIHGYLRNTSGSLILTRCFRSQNLPLKQVFS